jgi:hypothetical protein
VKGTIYINGEKAEEEKNDDSLKNLEISENKKSENNSLSDEDKKLSSYMRKFLKEYEHSLRNQKEVEGTNLKVSEVLGGLATLYEKIRTTVEYKGEHVLRRNAIERIIKRRIWQQGTIVENIDQVKIAKSLTKELIWARYLPNDTITKQTLHKTANVIGKYLYLLRNLDNIPQDLSRSKVRNWIWGVASSELEDTLDPSNKELYINLMYDWFIDRFNWTDEGLTDHDKEIQIYLAIHRAHAKSDDSIMRYYLLLKEFPKWDSADKKRVDELVLSFPKIYEEIEKHLTYHGRLSLYRKVQKHSAAFDLFREIAQEEKTRLRSLILDREKFEEKIRSVCELKYRQIRKKVNTGIVRSIIYIFLTKVVIAMLVEIPYEVYFYGDVKYLPLGINIIFPPFMMWIIGMSTKIPGAKNTNAIKVKLNSVSYSDQEKTVQNFSVLSKGRNNTLSTIFALFYLALFFIVFGGIAYLLTFIDYSLFGMIIFFFFLSLVVLFAYRVRYNAVQLRVASERETFFGQVMSYLMLPFLNFGVYLSKGLAKINFLSVILDFIIEAPLKSIIEVFEEWTSFIREKREEIVEIPEQ